MSSLDDTAKFYKIIRDEVLFTTLKVSMAERIAILNLINNETLCVIRETIDEVNNDE